LLVVLFVFLNKLMMMMMMIRVTGIEMLKQKGQRSTVKATRLWVSVYSNVRKLAGQSVTHL